MHDDHHDHDHGDCCGHSHDDAGHVHAGQPHSHAGHTHSHGGHTHSHDHADDSYTIDQLCMVGLSGAFGAICLSLYFWQTQMLANLLGPQFHPFILASGIVLMFVSVVRGYALWQQAGNSGAQELPIVDGHDHGGHAHHHHDHGPEDHDHGWAPWRYVVLLIPIVLFLLGLPNKGPEVQAKEVKIDSSQEAAGYARLVGLGDAPLNLLTVASALGHDDMGGEVKSIDFKALEGAAADPERRSYWANKTIEVRGQFSPDRSNDRVFSLVRFRISCCAADSIRLDVPMVSREGIHDIAAGDWVKVTGKVTFHEHKGTYQTVVRVPGRAKVEKCDPDPTYIQ